MALRNLGVPFGSPSRIFNVPAPRGSERAGQLPGLQQAVNQISSFIIQNALQNQQSELLGQDIQNLQQFGQGQEQFAGQGPMLPSVAQSLAQSMGGGQLQAPVSPVTGQPFISQPEFPTPQSNLFQQLTAQSLFRPAPKLTERQKLRTEGYSDEEIRRIRDIKHGIKPRASSTKTYNSMDLPTKAKYLATERTKAEGQYFGVEGGNVEARQPEYLEWILKEQKKVNKAMRGKQLPTDLPLKSLRGLDFSRLPQRDISNFVSRQPKTQAEYNAIPKGTIFIDTDGKRKTKR